MKRILVAILIATMSCTALALPRSRSARAHFMLSHPCPANGHVRGACRGFVVDHLIALDCGGADSPSNMQWQTVADGRAKDKWERKGCKNGHRIQ